MRPFGCLVVQVAQVPGTGRVGFNSCISEGIRVWSESCRRSNASCIDASWRCLRNPLLRNTRPQLACAETPRIGALRVDLEVHRERRHAMKVGLRAVAKMPLLQLYIHWVGSVKSLKGAAALDGRLQSRCPTKKALHACMPRLPGKSCRTRISLCSRLASPSINFGPFESSRAATATLGFGHSLASPRPVRPHINTDIHKNHPVGLKMFQPVWDLHAWSSS